MFLKASKEDFFLTKETSADKKWTGYTKNTQKRDPHLHGQPES